MDMFIREPAKSRCARGMQDFQNFLNKERRKFELDGQKFKAPPGRHDASPEPSKNSMDTPQQVVKKSTSMDEEYIKEKMGDGPSKK